MRIKREREIMKRKQKGKEKVGENKIYELINCFQKKKIF